MRRHMFAAVAGLSAPAFMWVFYYGFTKSGYPPVHAFGVFSIVMAVSLGAYFWYWVLKNWDRLRTGKWD